MVRRLYQSHRVKQDKTDGMISLPQVIVDGVNIGDHQALQALEDDGFLDGILRQATCPNCLSDREGEYCYTCKTLFQEMMPKRQTRDELMSRLRHQNIAFVGEDNYEENSNGSDSDGSGEDERSEPSIAA